MGVYVHFMGLIHVNWYETMPKELVFPTVLYFSQLRVSNIIN